VWPITPSDKAIVYTARKAMKPVWIGGSNTNSASAAPATSIPTNTSCKHRNFRVGLSMLIRPSRIGARPRRHQAIDIAPPASIASPHPRTAIADMPSVVLIAGAA
jgi:hypothetical protein